MNDEKKPTGWGGWIFGIILGLGVYYYQKGENPFDFRK